MFDGVVLVSFGGPRSLHEIEPFLTALLCDKDVVLTPFPQKIHDFLFKRIAKKRARKVIGDYTQIGGKSPVFDSMTRLQEYLQNALGKPVFVFHRYLEQTHPQFISDVEAFKGKRLVIFPLFPQFSYATSGSAARFFDERLSARALQKFNWIPSYAINSHFIEAYQTAIEQVMKSHDLCEKEICCLHSCHGIPIQLALYDDPYPAHCQMSFEALRAHFPKAQHELCFQSQFGKAAWLKPSTLSYVEYPERWLEKKTVLFVPLSFTSDHIETLFEIQSEYVQPLRKKGFGAFRVPAIEHDFSWVKNILKNPQSYVSNSMLIRRKQTRLEENLFQKHVEQDAREGASW